MDNELAAFIADYVKACIAAGTAIDADTIMDAAEIFLNGI